MRLSASTSAVIALVLQAVIASAQSAIPAAAPDPLVAAATDIARATKHQAQRDPLARSSLILPEPQLTLEATKGKGRATGTIGVVQAHATGETTYGLAISAPIGDADDAESRPLDLRGLSNGATVTASVGGSSLFKTFTNKDVISACSRKNVRAANCTAGKLEDSDPALADELLNIAFRPVPFLYAASFTYGRNQFKFFDAAGAKQDPIWHDNLEVEGSFGLLVNRRKDLLAFHVTYADVFTSSPDKTQLCRTLSGSTVSRCDAAVIGQPHEERSAIGTVEYRWQIRGNVKVPIAIAPKFQFALGLDDADDLRSIEVPIYFFQEKPPQGGPSAPKLNGGASTGWRSDTGFQAAVFVGATFHLFKL